MAESPDGPGERSSQLDTESREFVLVGVSLPRPTGEILEKDWELSYETSPPSWHFTVQMKGWSPAARRGRVLV